MSMIQVEDLVSYQLRTSYLTEIADGVGERLITLNDNFLNSASFKAAGWRTNPSLIRRTHSPPIPTAVAAEYFQAPRAAGLTLEDEPEEGSMLTGGGADTLGPGTATKRRRRREQMEEDDSSDLSDESDDEADQRAAQQIKFAKMPVRNRSGSSPIQSSNLRQMTAASSPRAMPPRRGSQSALETVKERARRDTVTSSEVSSENEFDASGFHRQREAARAAAKAVRIQTKAHAEPSIGIKRQESDLLEEEEDSDASDISSTYNESIDSASILVADENPIPNINVAPSQQVVGTPPREFRRASTIRRSHMPPPTQVVGELPPPRPLSTIRPISMMLPTSLLSAALKAKKTKPAMPFETFATLSGQGESNPIMLRIYAPFSKTPSKPFEVMIRRTVREENTGDRPVNVADLIGLSLWRYTEEKLEPSLPADKLNVNWWTIKMVEEGGEVDDDFPPLERTKPLTSFVTAPNNKEDGPRPQAAVAPSNRVGRGRSNTKVFDEFALVQASEDEFEDNQAATPQFNQEEVAEEVKDEELTPRNTPMLHASLLAPKEPRSNPVITTTWRSDTVLADAPRPSAPMPNTTRGQKKLLRIHILSSDIAPGQMVTLDVTTDTYMEEVLDLVCRKRQLDKANHVLKIPGSGALVLLDRPVAAIGAISDLELYRRRFATDGPLTLTGSPSSSSPRPLIFAEAQAAKKSKKAQMGSHPLAKEAIAQEELGNANYKKYVVWRKQTMRFATMNERILVIDGEYVHIVPSSGGKAMMDGGGKTTTVHFSNVIGCKVSRRHPTNFKLLVFKATESKRYDFEARSADEAAEIVSELKKGISPYRDV